MGKFAEFLKEQSGEKPYKLVVFNHHGEAVRDVDKEEGFTDNDKVIMKSAKAAGLELHMVDFIGDMVYKPHIIKWHHKLIIFGIY